jgi:drug/metabolite transporter (DMT)-like permease
VSISSSSLGVLYALGSALAWAVISLMVRTLPPHLSSVTINALRSFLSGAMLLAWVLATGGLDAIAELPVRVMVLLALSIIAASAIGDTVFFESTKSLGLARAMTVSTTYPLMATLLAAALLGEALTVPAVLGSSITLAGVALIVTARESGRGAEGRWPGLGLALLAALAWAVSVILLRAPLDQVDPITAQAVRLPIAGAALLVTPWGWTSHTQLRSCDRRTAVRLLLLGVVTTASSVFFVAGLKYGGVALATVLSATAPMFAIPLGVLFLGERLSARAVAGTAITVLGIAVLQA